MPLTCNFPNCDCAVTCTDAPDRVLDDAEVVVEEYECARGHTFHETIEL